ncbi:MAG: hypothetical protein JST46_01475 [Bacteroidetes bacterium]|nr:hypothetical protein [Bacteroidota bacterium]
MSLPNPFPLNNGKKATCREMLQVILDDEASTEQREYFKAHMEFCMPCFKDYELNFAIKQLLQAKCNSVAPDGLKEQIRNRIAQII